MDIEKTIEFILSHQANAEVQMEKIRESQANAEVQMERIREAQANGHLQHDQEMGKIRAALARGVRLSIIEGRNERRRRQEMAKEWDLKVTQLSAAQFLTEEKMQSFEGGLQRFEEGLQSLGDKMQKFLDGLQRGTNGHA